MKPHWAVVHGSALPSSLSLSVGGGAQPNSARLRTFQKTVLLTTLSRRRDVRVPFSDSEQVTTPALAAVLGARKVAVVNMKRKMSNLNQISLLNVS